MTGVQTCALPISVIFNGAPVAIENVDYTFEVAGAAPVTSTFQYVPHHGPIIAIDEDAGTALSVRWTGHDADTDVNFFLGLATSATVEDARDALHQVTTAGQNFVVIDRGGNIGWFPYMRLPTRPWLATQPELAPFLPLPGTGEAEWGPPIPYEDLPQALNPEAGFLATANNDMTGALQDGDETNGDLPYIQGVVDEGYRHQRITQLLGARGDHDLASMESIQSDVHSLLGEALVPEILALVNRDDLAPDGQAVYDAMTDWQGADFECRTGIAGTAPDGPADPDTAVSARGCLAFHATWGRLRDLVFGDELEAAGVDAPAQPSALIFLLTEDSFNQAYWDDVSTAATIETPAQIIATAIDGSGAFLREELGEPDAWLWGRLHTLRLTADLFNLLTDEFDSDTYTNDGGLFTVDVANPRNEIRDDYTQTAGPSMRLACQASEDGVGCTIELPGGQRHLRDSRFYTSGSNSMLPQWLANQPVPLIFSIDEAASAAVETVHVEPR